MSKQFGEEGLGIGVRWHIADLPPCTAWMQPAGFSEKGQQTPQQWAVPRCDPEPLAQLRCLNLAAGLRTPTQVLL